MLKKIKKLEDTKLFKDAIKDIDGSIDDVFDALDTHEKLLRREWIQGLSIGTVIGVTGWVVGQAIGAKLFK